MFNSENDGYKPTNLELGDEDKLPGYGGGYSSIECKEGADCSGDDDHIVPIFCESNETGDF